MFQTNKGSFTPAIYYVTVTAITIKLRLQAVINKHTQSHLVDYLLAVCCSTELYCILQVNYWAMFQTNKGSFTPAIYYAIVQPFLPSAT